MSLIKVTKYWSLSHTSLHMIGCRLTDLISFKYNLLLSKLNHEMNNLRKVLDKALIEVAEVNEELYLSKIRNSINELHHSLLILQECWKNIIINFVTELSLSEDYNVICMIIYHLIKEHHYVLCYWRDEDISVEETVWIMLWNVYWLHDLSNSIISDKDFQFISIMWKSVCKRLKITASLFIVYHSEINN